MNLVQVADEWGNNKQLGAEVAAVERVVLSSANAMGLMEEFISQRNENFNRFRNPVLLSAAHGMVRAELNFMDCC